MKPISELGLELIELEDQVLLVDENSKNQNIVNVQINGFRRVFEIIASTKPLEGLPLLVIEDDIIGKPLDDYIRTKTNQDQCVGFIEGYNKAKEIYKFTEEDLRKAIDMARKRDVDGCIEFEDEEIIQSLTKKELWIEVESHCIACDKDYNKSNRCKQLKGETSICHLMLDSRPKIINNQIKATYR